MDILWLKVQTDFFSDDGLTGRMNHPFISEFIVGDNLIMNPAEKLGIYFNLQFSFFRKGNAQILWTNHHFNGFVWSHASVNCFKTLAIELDQVVFDHLTWQDIRFSDKGRNKVVNRFIIDIHWRS